MQRLVEGQSQIYEFELPRVSEQTAGGQEDVGYLIDFGGFDSRLVQGLIENKTLDKTEDKTEDMIQDKPQRRTQDMAQGLEQVKEQEVEVLMEVDEEDDALGAQVGAYELVYGDLGLELDDGFQNDALESGEGSLGRSMEESSSSFSSLIDNSKVPAKGKRETSLPSSLLGSLSKSSTTIRRKKNTTWNIAKAVATKAMSTGQQSAKHSTKHLAPDYMLVAFERSSIPLNYCFLLKSYGLSTLNDFEAVDDEMLDEIEKCVNENILSQADFKKPSDQLKYLGFTIGERTYFIPPFIRRKFRNEFPTAVKETLKDQKEYLLFRSSIGTQSRGESSTQSSTQGSWYDSTTPSKTPTSLTSSLTPVLTSTTEASTEGFIGDSSGENRLSQGLNAVQTLAISHKTPETKSETYLLNCASSIGKSSLILLQKFWLNFTDSKGNIVLVSSLMFNLIDSFHLKASHGVKNRYNYQT